MQQLDKIFIYGLTTKAIIGISSEERKKKRSLVIDLEASVDISQAAKVDHIDHAVNYETLVNNVKNFVHQSQYQLLETLAEAIVAMIFNEFAMVQSLQLRIYKPKILSDVDEVGLMIERKRRNSPCPPL